MTKKLQPDVPPTGRRGRWGLHDSTVCRERECQARPCPGRADRPLRPWPAPTASSDAGVGARTHRVRARVRSGGFPLGLGNTLDVLVDGSEVLPTIAQELSAAQSYVHLAGWFFSPELQLSREEEPVIVRNLLAGARGAHRGAPAFVEGAPIPLFKPSHRDVREMLDALARHTRRSSPRRRMHGVHALPSREGDRDRRPGSFRRGVDLTLDGKTRTTRRHMSRAAALAGTTWRFASRVPLSRTSTSTSGSAGTARRARPYPPPKAPESAGDVEVQITRTLPAGTYRGVRRGDYSILESYLRCASVCETVHLSGEPVPLVARGRGDLVREA